MTPEAFINLWKDNELTERAGAQAHFDDLCDLLGVEKPSDPDNYCFERGAKKSDGGDGWADVWKRGFFGWENKKPGRTLDAALKQLTDYALRLENPPLLVVSDREIARDPILRPLDGIEHCDALLNPDGAEATWPKADVIIGNPPFLGDKMMRSELGDDYVEKLRKLYEGRVPGGADLVTYWFEKARAQIEAGRTKAAGLVATNVISRGANRKILQRIIETTSIFETWNDQTWVNEGAAVRVSLVCFGQAGCEPRLDGKTVAAIYADLTGSTPGSAATDLTQAQPLPANKGRSFFGVCLAGPFKVDTVTALAWLKDSGNPNGRPNSDVVRPIYNGSDITRRWAGNWVVDFAGMELAAAADLDTWREKWLYPEGWLDWEITPEEEQAGFPPRPVPKPDYAADWKKRTLTNLYNEQPAGLTLRQEQLDKAVAAAYGWTDYTPEISDSEILHRLLALNLEWATRETPS